MSNNEETNIDPSSSPENTQEDSPVIGQLPNIPQRTRQKPQPKPGKGRPKKDKELKVSAKKRKEEMRKALIEEMRADGRLSGPDARRMADKYGITLDGDVSEELIKDMISDMTEGTKDDPSITENINGSIKALKNKYDTQQKLIDIKGGKGISILDEKERITFLEFLSVGLGRHASCRQMKIDYRRFYNTFKCDDDFKSAVINQEHALEGQCMFTIYNQASNGDIGAAVKFIQLRHQNNQAKFTNKIQIKEQKMRERLLNAQLEATVSTDRPSFRCLETDELASYVDIHNRIKNQEPVTEDDLKVYGILSAKILAANTPKQELPPATAQFSLKPLESS